MGNSKFDLMIRYNLIAHCVHFGFFKENELCEKIYHSYMGPLWNVSMDEAFELEAILEDIESITICGSASINHGEEDKILSLTVGKELTINFDSLFNELLGECKGLMKEHKLVRKEIRRLLQIDAR